MHTLAAYRDTRGYLASVAGKPDIHDEAVRQLHELLVDSPCVSFDDCVRWAAKLFRKLFYTEIRQLVYQFPVFPREIEVICSGILWTRTGINSGAGTNCTRMPSNSTKPYSFESNSET